MSLFISSLNSGSNGNCYYIASEDDAILVDAGISCRETEKRMGRLGLSMSKVRAIFVSHEHSDHIKGIATLVKKHQVPVFITDKTLFNCRLQIPQDLVRNFSGYGVIQIGDLEITTFPKTHDAIDPHSFMISHRGVNVGVFTDIGATCDNVIHHFKQCHAAFLETNYDDDLLAQGSYPYFLKQRIQGGRGHLSNKQALDLFNTHKPPYMSYLLLSHLSKNNNCPILAHQMFSEHAGNVEIVLAPRDQETPVLQVSVQARKELLTSLALNHEQLL